MKQKPDMENYVGILECQQAIDFFLALLGYGPLEFVWYPNTIPSHYPGLYFLWQRPIFDENGFCKFQLAYIGQSKNIKARLKESHKVYDKWGTEIVGITSISNPDRRDTVELELIGFFNPPLNVAGRTDLNEGMGQ